MKKFSVSEFIKRISKRLIAEFDDASQAGTPILIGSAKENPARKQLERLLPNCVEIGSGIVIDSYGNQSKQQDIIIFERDYCPVFSINDTPESTYYPCEAVIAVGEVKSTLNSKEIEDSITKIVSVKKLVRRSIPSKAGSIMSVSYRKYGMGSSMIGGPQEDFNQDKKVKDQIYGFILCEKFGLTEGNNIEKVKENFCKYEKKYLPNLIVSLNDGFLMPFSSQDNKLYDSMIEANELVFVSDTENSFSLLLKRLTNIILTGRTVCVTHLQKYLDVIPGEQDKYIPKDCISVFEEE